MNKTTVRPIVLLEQLNIKPDQKLILKNNCIYVEVQEVEDKCMLAIVSDRYVFSKGCIYKKIISCRPKQFAQSSVVVMQKNKNDETKKLSLRVLNPTGLGSPLDVLKQENHINKFNSKTELVNQIKSATSKKEHIDIKCMVLRNTRDYQEQNDSTLKIDVKKCHVLLEDCNENKLFPNEKNNNVHTKFHIKDEEFKYHPVKHLKSDYVNNKNDVRDLLFSTSISPNNKRMNQEAFNTLEYKYGSDKKRCDKNSKHRRLRSSNHYSGNIIGKGFGLPVKKSQFSSQEKFLSTLGLRPRDINMNSSMSKRFNKRLLNLHQQAIDNLKHCKVVLKKLNVTKK